MPTQPKRRPIPERPKLAVYTDRATMKRLRMEKAATDRTMEDIVNTRIQLSFESHPGPLMIREPAATP